MTKDGSCGRMELQSFEQATRQYLQQSIKNLQFGIKHPNRRALFDTAFLLKMFLPPMATTWIILSRMDKYMQPFDPRKTRSRRRRTINQQRRSLSSMASTYQNVLSS